MLEGVLARPRRDDDLPGCVRALAAVHASDGYPMLWPVDPAAWLSPAGLAAAWVVEDQGVVAGHVGMVGGVDDPAVTAFTGAPVSRVASVTRLFVPPVGRGHRLGALLLGIVQRSAVERGLELMLEVVDDGGPAVALYDRLGWRVVEHRPAHWRTPQGQRPALRIYLAPDDRSSTP